MKKNLAVLLVLSLVLGLCACGGTESTGQTKPSPETLYAQLVAHATNGEFQEGYVLGNRSPQVRSYNDGQVYYDYCQAMRAYHAGGITYAYEMLKNMPEILDVKAVREELSELLSGFNGYYVSDNGLGSYLHVVIRDGAVANEVIGYNAEEKEFIYEDSDFYLELVSSKYDDGSKFVGIGNYNSLGADIEVDYVVNTFDDSDEIMLIKHAGYEYNTFNGVYDKIADVEPAA